MSIYRKVLAPVLIVTTAQAADTVDAPQLTRDGAARVVAAAVDYAQTRGAPGGSIAIVDAGGHLLRVERLDGTFPASADVAVGKARTAALFRRATRDFEDAINHGRFAMVPVSAVTDFAPLQGGLPIKVGDVVVGAIGVSGAASAQQDEEIAQAGAAALRAAPAVAPAQPAPTTR